MASKLYDVAPLAGLDPAYGLMGAMLEDGTREWLEEAGRIPAEAIGWQPTPGGHSIGAVMLHIIDVEAYWIEQVSLGRELSPEELRELMSEETKQYQGQWPAPPPKPWSWYVQLQQRYRRRTMESLKSLGDPASVVHGKSSPTGFTLRWILSHVVQHEAYHGGQIVLLKALWEQRGGGG
ncbi:MAG: DinB family protein [Fimbriimonas ginsengisoli]|uniref:DinB family protein n=1 Tax=Fimbriimonas ginsengisoli TaxID=1005039 RepID=A0A931PT04_FIMGI|nr:DinB family protein [Fimbriimonas ginsengisoli]